jgi:Leucine-rich repeat (LRR) protein
MADEGEEETEQPWRPSDDDISDALSGLAKTEDGASVVFTKLTLKGAEGRRLGELKCPVTLLENVRHLDVSNNKFISNINESVVHMDLLLSLNAMGNRIDAFDVPTKLEFLQTIDLSHNKLTSWNGIECPHLRYLNLSKNELSSVSGLDQNPELQTLLLADNKPLTSCQGLGLTSVRELTLTNCGLESLEGLGSLVLPTLDLSDNALKDLKGLNTTGVLKKLKLDGNPIESLDAIDALVEVGLTDLTLPEIPEAPADLRVQVIAKLSTKKDDKDKPIITLGVLNGAPVTPEEIEQVCAAGNQ